MKFISWNVNGLRACKQKGFDEFFGIITGISPLEEYHSCSAWHRYVNRRMSWINMAVVQL